MPPQKTVIITGGNSGLGYQTAIQLARTDNYHIVIASRNMERTSLAVQTLKEVTGYPHISAMVLDLASQKSVRQFVKVFAELDLPSLHAIICNAGLSLIGEQFTEDGIEMTFGVNHLGHFLLVNLLLEHLHTPARIVFVSSGTHLPEHRLARMTGVAKPRYVSAKYLSHPQSAPDGIHITNPTQRYSTSKLCNVLCAYELDRRLRAEGISTADKAIDVFAIDPGLMPGTGLVREFPQWAQSIFKNLIIGISPLIAGIRLPEESGRHVARLITDTTLTNSDAKYFDGLKETKSSTDSYDRDKAKDLWDTSVELSQLKPNETLLSVAVTVTA